MIIRKEGLPFIAAGAVVGGLVRRVFHHPLLRLLGWAPAAFCAWFFRDPQRQTPSGDDLVICPADGKVAAVRDFDDEKIGPCKRVSIFMSVFNVHVNRAPLSGKVVSKHHKSGEFHMANLLQKTELNERVVLYMETAHGLIRVDQVAGMIARRIACWSEPGKELSAGERFGLIRFGSMVECYLPPEMDVLVRTGDRVTAGETVIARTRE